MNLDRSEPEPAGAQTAIVGPVVALRPRLIGTVIGDRVIARTWVRRLLIVVYLGWSALLVREILTGSTSRVVLLLLPLVLVAANQFPQACVLAAGPIGLFSGIALGGILSIRYPVVLVAIGGFGLVTRRWMLMPWFHIPVGILLVFVAIGMTRMDASAGAQSLGSSSLPLVLGLCTLAAAACIAPKVADALVVMGLTSVALAFVVLSGLFRSPETRDLADDPSAILRVTALGLNPNSLGALLALGIVVWVGLAAERRNPLIIVLAIPEVLALPLLKSRSSLLLLAIGVLFVVFITPGKRGVRVVSIGLIALLVLMLFPTLMSAPYNAVLEERAAYDLSRSDDLRRAAATLALETAVENPWLGVGYGNFAVVSRDPNAIGFVVAVHNDFLRIAAELGLGALVCLGLMLVRVFRRMRGRMWSVTVQALLVTYVCSLAFTENLASLAVSSGFYVVVGAAAASGGHEAMRLTKAVPE